MKTKDFATIDGHEAAARVAYQLNEVIAIYPHHPGSRGLRAGEVHPWHFDLLAHDEGRLAKLIYASRNES